MERSERERELERARRLRELTERAIKRSQEARDRAEQLQRVVRKKPKPGGKAEGA